MRNMLGLLHKNLIPAYFFCALTSFAYAFGKYYTIVSYGETSAAIDMMWVFLRNAGLSFYVATALLCTLFKRRPYRLGLEVYASGVFSYTAGMFLRGYFEILGEDRTLLQYYSNVGIGLMTLGFILVLFGSRKAFATYRTKNEELTIFMEETAAMRRGAPISNRSLYALYQRWAYENGYPPEGRSKFANRLKKAGRL